MEKMPLPWINVATKKKDLLHKFFKSKPDSGSLQEQFVHSARRSTSFVLFIATFPLLALPNSLKIQGLLSFFEFAGHLQYYSTSAEFLSQTHAARSQSKPVRSKGLQFATQSNSLLLSKVQQLKWLCLGKLPPMFFVILWIPTLSAYWQQLATSNTVEMKATKENCFQRCTHTHTLVISRSCL